ncbi:MAG TPA: zf-HC2 domain-containing protein [Blastocatellia bacterium]|nr:zf-HC2 domain-containing protein [Blastocatellia bacterium]
MVCSQCQELLSDYIDGALELGEQINIERHLSDCEPCRAVRDDLLQIVHFSHQLPVQSPSTALWPRINAGLAELQPSFWNRSLRWLQNLRTLNINFSVPQMIATAAAIAIVVSTGIILSRRDNGTTPLSTAGITLSPSDPTPLSQADLQVLEKQISQLSESVEQRKDSWDPELRNAFERNLLYVNQSLAECRHQLSDHPGDDVSQELMLNAYREKIRLLEGFDKF